MTEEVNTNFDIDPYDDDLKLGGINPIRVLDVGKAERSYAADYGSCSYFSVPSVGIPPQILQRRETRQQAYVKNNDPINSIVIAESPSKLQAQVPQGFILAPGVEIKIEAQQPYWAIAANPGFSSASSASAQGAATDPGAGATIASIASANFATGQVYVITGSVYLDGTVTAADDDNMELTIAGINHVLNVGQSGNFAYGPFYLAETNTNATVKAIAAASGAAAVYHATIIATPYPFVPPQIAAATVIVSVRDESWIASEKRS